MNNEEQMKTVMYDEMPHKRLATMGGSGHPKADAAMARLAATSKDIIPPGSDRIVEKKIKGKWVEVPFSELTSGCTFRLFTADHEPIPDNRGNFEFIASCKASQDKSGNHIKIY